MPRSKNQHDVGIRNTQYETLQELAQLRGISVAVLVYTIIREYLDRLPVVVR